MKRRVMIDSGAFSAYSLKKPKPLSLDDYIAYIYRARTFLPDVEYINMDVIGDPVASYHNWKIMCKAGLTPIPVFHFPADARWLRRYLDKTDYVALGAIAKLGYSRKRELLDQIWRNYFVNANGMPVVKVHGLGMTLVRLMRRYPWYSVDSTSFLQPAAFGQVFIPVRRQGKPCYTRLWGISVSAKSGNRKIRGAHWDNIGFRKRAYIKTWLHEHGIPFGESRIEDGEEIVVERGLVNDWWIRVLSNALYYIESAGQLAWPRSFNVKIPGSFLSTDRARNNPVVSGDSRNTLLYLGGYQPIENLLHQTPELWSRVGVMVSYYNAAGDEGGRIDQRLMGIAKGTPYEAPTGNFSGKLG